ncbi:MAG: CDP-alcohol phosphatidyltransferase family protein [Verrucomicrobia bacterium]|nr:CDP-alcohol phosphatidyltransferase family protein [Verrucomicrobiota bacterium]MBS0647506.1 CDP-alcohol phosphatidyltransferase family protein [Verrucomicrobiota bacterium]
MKRLSLLPNVITAFSLSCGLFVIFRTIFFEGGSSAFLLLQSAAFLVLIAAFADVADGAIARLIKAESDFGGEFDSLSDSVTFGVAPPLVILHCLKDVGFSHFFDLILIMAAMIFTLCGILRLVRYNLTRKLKKPAGLKGYFTGLPIPAGASLVLSSALMLVSPWSEEYLALKPITKSIIMMAIFVMTGYFMISRLRFASLSRLYFRLSTFYVVLVVGVLAVFILYGILNYFAWVFFILSWGYFVLSCLRSLYRWLKGDSNVIAEEDPMEIDIE